jgi:hypothetical protein
MDSGFSADCYGKSARGNPVAGMFVWTNQKNGKKYLAVKKGESIEVLYRLMLSVTVRPDSRALPNQATFEGGFDKVLTQYFNSKK